MIAQKSHVTTLAKYTDAVEEAMRLIAQQPAAQRWVCEVCGMVHTGSAPAACESCGVSDALVQQADLHREIHNRWC